MEEFPDDGLEWYFKELREHVQDKIHGGKVGDSCFAAAMLVFAAVDSLGCLMDKNAESKVGKRFKNALKYLGPEYEQKRCRLYDLRCNLMHNALNVATYFAENADGMDGHEHLEVAEYNGGSCIWLRTDLLSADLNKAISKVKADLNSPAVRKRAASRVETITVTGRPTIDGRPFSPPSEVRFRLKERGRKQNRGRECG